MRNRVVWLMVALGIGSMVSGAGRAQDVVNLLVNAGFEDGVVAPWGTWGGVTITVVQELAGAMVQEGPIEGGNCLHVTSPGSANYWDMGLSQKGMTFRQGKHYTLSAFLKCKKGTLQVNFKPELAQGPWTSAGEQSVTMTEEWAEYHFTTGTFSANLTPCEVVIDVGYAPSDFWIDAIRFYEGDYVPTVLKPILTASRPSPESGAVDVPRDPTLSWTSGPFANTHDVYLGAAFADVNSASTAAPLGVLISQGQTGTAWGLTGLLDFDRTYYWRVDEVNAPPDNTVYQGDVWSFTTEPYSYPIRPIKATASSFSNALTGPDKTIDGSGLDALDQHSISSSQMWLSKKNVTPVWIQYEFNGPYKIDQMWVWNQNQMSELDYCFGAKDVTIEVSTDGTTWTALGGVTEFAQGTGEPNYVHNTTVDFGGVLAKYVKLTIFTNWADGTKQAGLSEVRFFYVPVRARAPQPASGAAGVALDGVLNWRPGREAAKHDVLFGTDQNAVVNGTAPAKTVTPHSLDLSPLGLEYDRTYYWKVNEVNAASSPSTWEGDVWSFSTVGYAVVDDFESYNDLCNKIFYTWVDQSGYNAPAECGGASAPGNGSGAMVGNPQAPYAERTIVHGGNQALPMTFDNKMNPYYSETHREWGTPQAWNGGGANTLRVYLQGEAAAFIETSPGTIIMNGTGTDIWTTTDEFRFVYKALKGNGSIIARVDNLANTDPWAKAGVMIRETLDAGSTYADTVISPTSGGGFQRRIASGGDSTSTDVAGLAAPYWVKLTRTGNTFTAQQSGDGVAWIDMVATPAITIPMANDVYIGLAVTSHAAGLVCGAKFSNVSTTGTVTGSWQVAEIGTTQVAGNVPETFYVAVQDGAGKQKVVSHPDPAVIATGNWEEWNIPLNQFTSAGVSLNNVKKLIVGVGDRLSPKTGYSGKLYIDDIRLTRVSP